MIFPLFKCRGLYTLRNQNVRLSGGGLSAVY
jgi:hypothetical protein